MAWIYLWCAIAAEIVATSLLGSTEVFTQLVPTVVVLATYAVSFFLLARAVESIALGVAYALWAGLGTALIATVGVIFLGEPLSDSKIVGLLLVIAGVVVLNLQVEHAPTRDEP